MAKPFSAWPDQISVCEIDDADEYGIPISPQKNRAKWLLPLGLAILITAVLFLMGLVQPVLP